MLVVHHLGISQSDRIVWLCEELGLDYQLVRYDRDPVTRRGPQAYKALHPYGTAPVIQDGDLTLAESGAIVEYLIRRYGADRLALPPDHRNYPDYLYWFHFANGSFMPAGLMALALQIAEAPLNERVQGLLSRGARAFDLVEQRLAGSPYLAGPDFTVADLMMNFPLTTMRLFVPYDLSPHPNIRAYLQRIAERPAYRRARAKADPGLEPNLT